MPTTDAPTPAPAPAGVGVRETALPGVLEVLPRVFRDPRGHFAELHVETKYAARGIAGPWVQDNVAWSGRGVLRGLHFQHPRAQGKLVTALAGSVFDVAVDVRVGSPTFARWVGVQLDAAEFRQLWIPAGFAHGYLVLGDDAVVGYKCTEYYQPDDEVTVRWDDADVAVAWPAVPGLVSDKDRAGLTLADAARQGRLPSYADFPDPG